MANHKIIPSIWFNADKGNSSMLLEYYKEIFADNFIAGNIIPLGNTPSGNAEMCEVKIFGQPYSFLNTSNEHHPLNDAISFVIRCDNQIEIDTYWNYFTKDGKASQCGWCADRYGLRWQIIPVNLGQLMARPNAFDILMQQHKIIINDFLTQ